MRTVGAEITPERFEYQWVASVVRAVEERTGKKSRWDGKLNEEPFAHKVGAAFDGGGLTVSEEHVLKPLREAYAGGELTDDQVEAARDAAVTVVHEALHLVDEFGDEEAPGAVPIRAPEEVALDEGLNETRTHRIVDVVIQDIEMDAAVPGVLDAETVDSYPAYTAATDELVQGVAFVSAKQPEEVRQLLEDTPRAQRWGAVADVVIDERLGDGLMPEAHRDHVRGMLLQAMRPEFASVVSAQHSEVQSDFGKTIAGHQAAQRTVTALSTTLDGVENHYRDWHRSQAVDQLSRQPEGQQTIGTQAERQGAGVQVDGPGEGSSARVRGMSGQEVAELRRLTGGVAPAAGAVRAADPGQGSSTPGRGASPGLATVHPIRRNQPPGQGVE